MALQSRQQVNKTFSQEIDSLAGSIFLGCFLLFGVLSLLHAFTQNIFFFMDILGMGICLFVAVKYIDGVTQW